MTPAEKFAESLSNLRATPMEREAAALIRRLAAALVDAETSLYNIQKYVDYQIASHALRHADALRDVKDAP